MRLHGKVVVITGAASGIGAALALRFAERGAQLALIDRDEAGLASTTAAVSSRCRQAPSQHLVDLREPEAFPALRDEILRLHGRVEVLVNCAGLTVYGRFGELKREDFDRVLRVNLLSLIELTRTFLPDLVRAELAHIVNISSEAGLAGMPYQSAYCTSKFAVRGFSESLRAELAASRVGVTCVMPGATRTNILSGIASTDPGTSVWLHGLLSRYAPKPARLAKKIVRAVERNRAQVVMGPDAWALWYGVRLLPGVVRWSMRRVASIAQSRQETAGQIGEPR